MLTLDVSFRLHKPGLVNVFTGDSEQRASCSVFQYNGKFNKTKQCAILLQNSH